MSQSGSSRAGRRQGSRWFLLLRIGAVALLLAFDGHIATARPDSPGSAPIRPAPAAPSGWLDRVQEELAEKEYEISWQASPSLEGTEPCWHAANRAQGFRAYFTSRGIRVVPRHESSPSWRWGLSLAGYGKGGETWSVPRASLAASGHSVDYHRGALRERYQNTRRGLEQTFVLPAPPGPTSAKRGLRESALWTAPLRRTARPAAEPGQAATMEDGRADDPVHVDLSLWGDLSPRIAGDGQAIDFVTSSGTEVVHYAGLKVTDARGAILASWMEGFTAPGTRGIRLVIDARGASYPITVDPLATGPAWTAEGDQADARFGLSVATAGDVNADGFSDVIVGAPFYDNGQTDEGRACLYLGSASGLATAPSWTAESDRVFAGFGISVATAGDVNGDGRSDVIIGADRYDNGALAEGRAFVYPGTASGLAGSPLWTAESDQAFSRFGLAVASAGDVNGDGYSDILVGAPYYDNGEADEGRAYLYLGSGGGPGAIPAWTAESDQAAIFNDGTLFGSSVATAGDVNGDGYSDVVVGCSHCDNGQTNEGRAFVYLGSGSGLGATAAWTAESNQPDAEFGFSVATAGDVNGDGHADVVIGAGLHDNFQLDEGRAFLYLGSASGLATTPGWTAESDQSSALFGASVATAGDVNGDGYSDVLVGASNFTNGEAFEGRGYLYLGSASGLATIPAWTAEGNQAKASFGLSVATAGDVNGDGYADVIVGSHQYDNGQTDEGRAFVHLGSPSGPVETPGWAAESDQVLAAMGGSVGTAGDVNGDGYADVLVGAELYDNGQFNEGRAYLHLGSSSGLSQTPAWTAEGDVENANFGSLVGTAGDINGDGYSDVIVSAAIYNNSAGRVYVYLGSASGLAPTPAWTAEGDQAYGQLGWSAGTAGDINQDGFADVIIGNPFRTADRAGRAYLYLGSASGLSSNPAWVLDGEQIQARFGQAVGTAGDVNRDGYSDVIISAPGDANDAVRGKLYVYPGSPSGLPSTPWTIDGNQATEFFGGSAGTAGDVNGDGYADVIVGAAFHENGQFQEGSAYLYLGSSTGPSPTPAWMFESNQVVGGLGTSVGTAGDVNGDGHADVIVGAYNSGRAFVFLGSASGLSPTPDWVAGIGLPGFTGDSFASSTGSAGDVNGDGFADIIVGAVYYDNGQSDEGGAFLYYGNGGPGLALNPRQRRQDFFGFHPIAPGGRSNAPGSFALQTLGKTPFGRSKVSLEWEIKPLGNPLDGQSIMISSSSTDTGTAGANLIEQAIGLDPGSYHWRLRLRYDSAKTPFAQRSRWLTIPWHGWQEAHLTLGAFLGGWMWDDLDGDGVREDGEPGRGGATVSLVNSSGAIVDQRTTIGDGYYSFPVPGAASSFRIRFQPPAGTSLTLQDQGDDTLDSDADPATGLTALIGPVFAYLDNLRWSAGLACNAPTLPVSIDARTVPGSSNLILDVTDSNPLGQVTGYNVYRASQPQPPPAPWTLLGADVTDNDPSTPNVQWSDTTGTAPPQGTAFYYQVTAVNRMCGTEGPR